MKVKTPAQVTDRFYLVRLVFKAKSSRLNTDLFRILHKLTFDEVLLALDACGRLLCNLTQLIA